MSCTRKEFVSQMQSWIGLKESNGSHKQIIDIYNTIKPLPVGYKLKYNDAWCAGTVSAAAQVCDATDIIPTECSCPRMITKAKSMGIWVEADNHVPLPGDIPMYDWDDNGKGDNTGGADHVGVVEECDGKKFVVIEGNYSNSVKRRNLEVNGKYIRGFIVPKFDAEQTEAPKEQPKVEPTKTITQVAREVLNGKWGNGSDRKKRLIEAGYDYNAVQKEVNRLYNSSKIALKSNEAIAKEVIQGKWGTGATRKKKLTDAGYDYNTIQALVNKMLK